MPGTINSSKLQPAKIAKLHKQLQHPSKATLGAKCPVFLSTAAIASAAGAAGAGFPKAPVHAGGYCRLSGVKCSNYILYEIICTSFFT